MSLDELEEIKKILKSIIIPHQMGLDPATLNKEYEDIEGASINYQKFGYNNLVDFLLALNDTLIYDYNNNVIFPVVDETTAHIRKFVINQRSSKNRNKFNSGVFAPSKFCRRSKSPSQSIESRKWLSSNFLINQKRNRSPSPRINLIDNAKTELQTYNRTKLRSPSPKRCKRFFKEKYIYRSETFSSNKIESFNEPRECRKKNEKDESSKLSKNSQMIEKYVQTDNLFSGLEIGVSNILTSSKSCQTDSSLDKSLIMPKTHEHYFNSYLNITDNFNPILNLRDPRIRKSLINKRDLASLGIVINQETILKFAEKALDINQKFLENHNKLKNATKFGISLPVLVPSEPVDSPFQYLCSYLESENTSPFLTSFDPRLRKLKNENTVNSEGLIQHNTEYDQMIPDYIPDEAYLNDPYHYKSYYNESSYENCHCSDHRSFTCEEDPEFPGYYFDANEGIYKTIPIQYYCCGKNCSTSVSLSNTSEENKKHVKKLSIDDYKSKFGIKPNETLNDSEED